MHFTENKADIWSQQIKNFGRLVGYIAVASFLLMVLGAAVRATDSGLACPDWPLCYGQLVPMFDMHIFLEWLHRALAGTVTLLVIAALIVLKKYKILRFEFGRPLGIAFLLLVVQIILGGLTIFKLLDPKVVSLHLINALFFFTILVWINHNAKYKFNKAPISHQVPRFFAGVILAVCCLTLCQIFLGGLVSTHHAGLACPDFPTCHGQWFPSMSLLVGLQVSHRFLGFTLVFLALILSFTSSRLVLPRSVSWLIRILPFLLVAQITLGMVNVYMQLPKWASISHLTVALFIYTVSLKAWLGILSANKTTLQQARGSIRLTPQEAR